MTKICLFAGTTEGRRLAEFLSRQKIDLTVCVATEYGGSLIEDMKNISLSCKRLSGEEITQLLKENRFDLVIDATHPYAVNATENIQKACLSTNTEYQRLLRSASSSSGEAVILPDIPSAVDFLNNTTGNILLTTGSKEIQKFTGIRQFEERIYTRVLPIQSSLESCTAAGVKPSHIIAMQGPFSKEINIAMLHSCRAAWLVTKDSGETGGFDAKVSAALETNTGLIVIGRPPQTEGISEEEMIGMLCERYDFPNKSQVSIVGIGPGSRNMISPAAKQAITEADCLIGAGRMLETVPRNTKKTFEAIAPQTIAGFIQAHPEYRKFAVLMSGDSGFYSGTRLLLPLLNENEVQVFPGISSLSYLCAKLHISYEDIPTLSLHGRNQGFLSVIRKEKRLFLLTGGENSVNKICQKLCEAGLTDLRMTVGERLSYPDEKIITGSPDELGSGKFAPLSVILVENDHPETIITHGLPDETFFRDSGKKGLIPMTKSEIRSICLSKLALTEDALCWDIGSGTGSVGIEMALQVKKGQVYGIESDPDAVELSRKNASRLSADNLTIIQGTAPEACSDLPDPSHVFIGGSSGNMRNIIQALFARKSEMNIVATAVTMDSIAELNAILNEFPFAETEVVLVQTAQAKKAGTHRLMLGGNPVYIFFMRIAEKKE